MNSQPLISIIIPIYNPGTFLAKCLDSIIEQTYSNYEAILVDDGSVDGSGEICDQYANKDKRFVVIHKKNEGVVKARETAFNHSKGELITFIDSDDYIDSKYLEELALPIIEQNADISSCDFFVVTNEKTVPSPHNVAGIYEGDALKKIVFGGFFYNKILRRSEINFFLWSKMLKREVVGDALSVCDGIWYGEDQLILYVILQKCRKLVLIPNLLYYYVQHQKQSSRQYKPSIWENIIKLMQQYEKIDKDGSAKKGRRYRTWLYIDNIIKTKMLKSGMKKQDFCLQIRKVRNHSFMKKFFKPICLGMGFRHNILYLIMKFKLYSLYYFLQKKI